MPLAVLNNDFEGEDDYRKGDRASHTWRINTEKVPPEMFVPDGTALSQDVQGTFLTLNFSCLGCHDGIEARLEDFEAVRHVSTLIH